MFEVSEIIGDYLFLGDRNVVLRNGQDNKEQDGLLLLDTRKTVVSWYSEERFREVYLTHWHDYWRVDGLPEEERDDAMPEHHICLCWEQFSGNGALFVDEEMLRHAFYDFFDNDLDELIETKSH